MELRLWGREREVSLDWRRERQEVEVGRSGSLKREVSLRYWDRATP